MIHVWARLRPDQVQSDSTSDFSDKGGDLNLIPVTSTVKNVKLTA